MKNNTIDFGTKENEIFSKCLKESKVYGEYGCGGSTVFSFKNFTGKIISIDSSKEWIEIVKKQIDINDRIILKHIDIGTTTKDGGHPIDNQKCEEYPSYHTSIWDIDQPDFVLIDGRFRVACFLKSLLKSKIGTKIFFDDYMQRPFYHCIEKFLKPKEITSKIALFVKEENVNHLEQDIEEMYQKYKNDSK